MENKENLNEFSYENTKVKQYFVFSDTDTRIEMDENIQPTEISDYPFLYHKNTNILKSFTYLPSKLYGKWMMFFDHADDFDKKWKDSCKLYDEGKLCGIRSMKCSTKYINPRASDHTTGVILFYCGPMTDESKMLEYGKNLLDHIPYYTKYGFMFYKSDEQTYQGTRATGNRSNSLYRIPVPKTKTL